MKLMIMESKTLKEKGINYEIFIYSDTEVKTDTEKKFIDFRQLSHRRKRNTTKRFKKAMKPMTLEESVDYVIENCSEWIENPVKITRSIDSDEEYFYSVPVRRFSTDNSIMKHEDAHKPNFLWKVIVDVVNPKNNGFKLLSIPEIYKNMDELKVGSKMTPDNKLETWTDSPCIFIQNKKFFQLLEEKTGKKIKMR